MDYEIDSDMGGTFLYGSRVTMIMNKLYMASEPHLDRYYFVEESGVISFSTGTSVIADSPPGIQVA